MALRSKIFFVVLSVLFLAGCANRGAGPQGGPRDETPPRMIRSNPPINAVNHKDGTIELRFDEFLQLRDIAGNLVISPPQERFPVIRMAGRRITVELQDTLRENTTYTIDFGNAIVDNNEGNVLENFTFAFSTGSYIDSLEVRGILLDAETLTPVPNVFVGIHSDLSDSAFISTPFLRVSRTNSRGEFVVRNVKDGIYRVFALGDQNSNFFFDQAAEWIAFHDYTITPTMPVVPRRRMRTNEAVSADTIPVDTLSADTVALTPVLPLAQQSPLILRFFQEERRNQFLVQSERNNSERFTLIFNVPMEELPRIEALNFEFEGNYLLQTSSRKDTLIYWLKDEKLISLDTLNFILHYHKTDSLGVLQPTQDTLFLTQRRQPAQRPAAAGRGGRRERNVAVAETEEQSDFLTFTTNIAGRRLEYYAFPTLRFNAPVKVYYLEKIQLQQNVRDTIWENLPFEFNPLDAFGIAYELVNEDLRPGERYRLVLDSAAFRSIHARATEEQSFDFAVRRIEEYSTLIVNITPFDSRKIVQLLRQNGEVAMQERVEEGGTVFDFITPGMYFLRLFIDENENEKWDTGNFLENRQPERMYYFNKAISLRANWVVEEDWQVDAVPILQQKPPGIRPRQF